MDLATDRPFGEPARALIPFGHALRAYAEGRADAQISIRRDDGFEASLPVSHFFRDPGQFSPIENTALERCHGHVLDVGAGTGLHALALQSRGLTITCIDICPEAVDIMVERGVATAVCADIFTFDRGPFDTVLMLGHGIGMVENLDGLDRFLHHVSSLSDPRGQVLLHSMDVRATGDPANLAYHEANRAAGRYVGETRIRFEFDGQPGPYCGWLHVDCETLTKRAAPLGWRCEMVLEQAGGDYVARLSRAQ